MTPETKSYTVSQVTAAVKGRIEEHFAEFWVAGEVTNYKKLPSTGHMYFSLKDAGAVLPCQFRSGFNLRMKFEPRDGMQVLCRGGLTVYPPQGKYQLEVQEFEPKGVGAAELALQQLKDKLRAKGYFAIERRRPMPVYPRCIALVTSSTGAAIRDMIELLAQRWPMTRVVVRSSRVQGQYAPEELAASLRMLCLLSRKKLLALDAIVLGRGGGAAADLSAFNEEIVADAIYDSSVPVVSAVGHETDVTIADLVADKRAETPTAAIVLLTRDCREVMADLRATQARLQDAMLFRVQNSRQRVQQLAERPGLRRPQDRILVAKQKIDERSTRLNRAAQLLVSRGHDTLAAATHQLQALSPLNVLTRGYSLTQRTDGTVLRSSSGVVPGDVIETRLAEGSILSCVLGPSSPTPDSNHGQ